VNRKPNTTTETTPVRCGIYVRVSTPEQAVGQFTSIDNQAEMARAFIMSQAGQGWVALGDPYADAGFSAASIDRPALTRLLRDIASGLIDCVVVYKLDRLSRSLSDFVALLDRFRTAKVGFVSVTENFSTTTSVGRFTLNLLASFAEFERATVGDRTRDKIAGAKRRGRWCGGFPVLGYDCHPDGGMLVVNPEEAETVRQIYYTYLDLRSLQATAAELCRRGVRTKSWTTRDGTFHEGVPFNKNHLSRLLKSPLFIGRVSHRGQTFRGEHPAIVDEELYSRVQTQLASNCISGGAVVRNRYGHLLRGLLFCSSCNCAMTPSVTRRRGKAYRYYICSTASKTGWRNCLRPSLPAAQIEDAVVERIKCVGRDPSLIAEVLAQIKSIKMTRQPALIAERRRLDREHHRLLDRSRDEDGDHIAKIEARLLEVGEELAVLQGESIDKRDLTKALSAFSEVWDMLFPAERERVIALLVERIDFDAERETVAITFRPTGIRVLAEEIAEAQEVVA
jgi:site-specific DNA recombinase